MEISHVAAPYQPAAPHSIPPHPTDATVAFPAGGAKSVILLMYQADTFPTTRRTGLSPYQFVACQPKSIGGL